MELKKLERCQKFAKKFLTLPFRSYWSLICDSRCLVNQTFFSLCFLRQSWSPTIRMGVTWGTLFNWGVSGWGIGRLCGGVGGWSSRLEAPPKPRPRHQAPTEVPEGSSANSSPHQPICHHQQACLWRIQGKWFAAPTITTSTATCAAKVDIPLMLTRCISLRIHFNFYTLIINQSHPIFSWLLTRPNWARKVREMILFIGGPVDWVGAPVDRWDMGNMSTSTMSMSRWHCINMVWHGITWYDMV